LTLNSVADDGPSFHAMLQNPKHSGVIRADGQFGPLRTENIGQTVLSGSYVFHADLGAFPGRAGMLSSTDKFNGVLEEIEVAGKTNVPDFEVTRTHHAMHLKTQFQAIVDGMDGEIVLQSVHAQFARTSVESRGEVANKTGSEGKTLSLVGTGQQGHIYLGCESYRTDFKSLIWQPCDQRKSDEKSAPVLCVTKEFLIDTRSGVKRS
jgi:hypothetical protein